jgi:membrane protein
MATRLRRAVDWLRGVQRGYSSIGGPTLAAGVALYGFLALFALLVLAVAVLGFLSVDNQHLARDITHELGLTGDAAKIITDSVNAAQDSRRLTTIVGVVGIVWLGTSFSGSIANAYNVAWKVTDRGVRERVIGLGWLVGIAGLAAIAGWATALWDLLPGFFAPLVVVVTLAGNAALLLFTSWVLPNRKTTWRTLLVPALLGAVALEVLKVLGAYVVPHFVENSSELYGTIGVVFAILLWLMIFGRLIVYLAVLEARRGSSGG